MMKKNDRYLSIFSVAVGVGAAVLRALIDDIPNANDANVQYAQIYMSFVGIVSLGVVLLVLFYKLKRCACDVAASTLATVGQEERCLKTINCLYISSIILVAIIIVVYLPINKSSTANDVIAILALTFSLTTDWIIGDFGEAIGKSFSSRISKK